MFKTPLSLIKSQLYTLNSGYNYFKNLLNHTDKCQCIYVNRYGEKCLNVCLQKSPFKMRQLFCDYHIKNHIEFIIKLNLFVSKFIKLENEIKDVFYQNYNFTKFNMEKRNVRIKLNEFCNPCNFKEEILLIVQPILRKLKHYYFKGISYMIFDTYEYRERINFLKNFQYETIILKNKENRKNAIELLKQMAYDYNTVIGKTFKDSKIGDINVIDIIGKYY